MQAIIRLVFLTGGLLAFMPLLLLVTLIVAIDRWWLLKRTVNEGTMLHSKLRQIGYRNIEGLRDLGEAYGQTLQGHLVATAVASLGESADELENHLEEEIMNSIPLVTRRLWILDTSVTIAPLLGLFGTIIGMIQAFNVLSRAGGPAKITGGIAGALVSTAAGLLIAIVAVYFVNYFNSLSRQIVQQLDLTKVALINRLHSRGLSSGQGNEMTVARPNRYVKIGA